jgi:hypothetical protein
MDKSSFSDTLTYFEIGHIRTGSTALMRLDVTRDASRSRIEILLSAPAVGPTSLASNRRPLPPEGYVSGLGLGEKRYA